MKERLHAFLTEDFADLISKVDLNEIVDAGVPYNKLVEKAHSEYADVLVTSTHGPTGFRQVLLGSVTAKVVAQAGCPVMSMRPA